MLRERLLALAAFSDDMAAELGNPELRRHADLYRDDAARLPESFVIVDAPELE